MFRFWGVQHARERPTNLKCFNDVNVGYRNNWMLVETEVFLSNDDTLLHQILVDERAVFLGHQHFQALLESVSMKSNEI